MECCLSCRNYVCDYGYWFCRKENDDEDTKPNEYKCDDYSKDDDI